MHEVYERITKQTGLQLSPTAIRAMVDRYLLRDDAGEHIIEIPEDMFNRVATAVAEAERKYNCRDKQEEDTKIRSWRDEFYRIMTTKRFMPNSPTLMNAGTPFGQLSACFVLPVEDSMVDIFDTLKAMALILQSGGGTGFSFSNLRSSKDIIASTKMHARGPIPFINVYNAAAETVKQSGKRHGANMAVLRVDHPDIISFITMKSDTSKFTSFNISVGITDEFMQAVICDDEYPLISPSTGKELSRIPAKRVFELIVRMAHKNGEPGMVFLDTINDSNTLPKLGRMHATNPCGEQPLFPWESCNLGSINLSAHMDNGIMDFDDLERTIRSSVRFLDNVIETNRFVPQIPQIQEIATANRKIGLGVMGFADMLIKQRVPYASEEAFEIADQVMEFVEDIAMSETCKLGEERGPFPNIDKSIYRHGKKGPRNSTLTTIAPTGTISIFAGCSYGIEPLMVIAFIHKILDGQQIPTMNPLFIEVMKERGLDPAPFFDEIMKKVSIRHVHGIPDDIKDLFVTSHDIRPEGHLRMQMVFQRHVDNAVSKTINMRESASPEDIAKAAVYAWNARCKGFTVYRNNSRPDQPLGANIAPEERKRNVMIDNVFAGKLTLPIDMYNPDIDDDELALDLLYPDEAEVQYVPCPDENCDNEKAIKVKNCVRCDVCGFDGCMLVS